MYEDLSKLSKTNNLTENQVKGHELTICRRYQYLLILTSLVITKMLIKPRMCYLSLIRLVKIKKINNVLFWQIQVEKRALTDAASGNENSILYIAFLEDILAVPI